MGNKQERKLKPAEIKDLVQKTKLTTSEVKLWYQRFIQNSTGNNYLGIEEFKRLYTELFPTGDAAKFAEHVFRTFDSNKDGSIDFKEFITALSISSNGSLEQKLQWAFNMYDLDGNGYITEDEMVEIFDAIFKLAGKSVDEDGAPNGEATAKKYAEQIFTRMDKNSDGMVSLDEFVEGAKSDPMLFKLLQM